MPSRISRWWICRMWMMTMMISLGVAIFPHTVAADPGALSSPHADSRTGSLPSGVAFERLPKVVRAASFDSLHMWGVDANIPPEAMPPVIWRHRTDVAQALPRDNEDDLDDFDDLNDFDDFEIEYDPWERYNRAMFAFNQRVDRFVLRPVAVVWDTVVPDLAQQSLSNAFDNIAMPRRLVNNIFQRNIEGAGRELARFFINISMGVLGFFDAAADIGLPKITDADTGLTLGYYGVRPGPYLVLPFLPPLTVRDAFGYAADSTMHPLSYFLPLEATTGMRGGQIVNDRALNLEFFDQLEREVFDLYAAVRNGYLQRRQRAIDQLKAMDP